MGKGNWFTYREYSEERDRLGHALSAAAVDTIAHHDPHTTPKELNLKLMPFTREENFGENW